MMMVIVPSWLDFWLSLLDCVELEGTLVLVDVVMHATLQRWLRDRSLVRVGQRHMIAVSSRLDLLSGLKCQHWVTLGATIVIWPHYTTCCYFFFVQDDWLELAGFLLLGRTSSSLVFRYEWVVSLDLMWLLMVHYCAKWGCSLVLSQLLLEQVQLWVEKIVHGGESFLVYSATVAHNRRHLWRLRRQMVQRGLTVPLALTAHFV